MKVNGKVWLVGAGPGDAGLLTIKGKQLLESADIILYDALISTEIMSLIPSETEKINVGKRAANHKASQDEINRLLLEQAWLGKKVVRLKGGDPFVFGRGGEELELLVENQIPFEIVPGITSAVAAPAFAGIPITHRDFTSSFHVITGHAQSGHAQFGHAQTGGNGKIAFDALVKLEGTLVFLMGISNMQMICEGLQAAGMDKEMPAAVVERGTCAKQRKVVATIGTLCVEAQKAHIQTPAIILVGRVCTLADQFTWAEKRILGGKQYITTRPQRRSSQLTEKLRNLGAQVIEMPAIRTACICKNEQLQKCLYEIGTQEFTEEWLVLTSPTGVILLWEEMQRMHFDIRNLWKNGSCIKFAAIGSATAQELQVRGIIPDIVPDTYCAEDLGKKLAVAVDKRARVNLLRAKEGSALLFPPLLEAQIRYRDIPIYETQLAENTLLTEQVIELLRAGEIDAVTFTSASTVRGFVQMIESEIKKEVNAGLGSAEAEGGLVDYRKLSAVCIGEQTAAEARKYHMKIHIAKEATIDSMVTLLSEL